jgi:formate dehydrogenase subunit gamma
MSYGLAAVFVGTAGLNQEAAAQTGGAVPGKTLGNQSDSEFWRAIRRGAQGNVSTPDKAAGIMVQSEGENWRSFRNGPLSTWGAWSIFGTLALLALFFMYRGRIPIDAGESGKTVERFNSLERIAHWLLANSFILLALTGLNMLYGRYVLKPFIGAEAFSTLTLLGKYVHNYVAFAFMLALVAILVFWIRENFPTRADMIWLAKGGGLFTKGNHPPANKFNAGQKILFWLVLLGGLSISVSGIALLFPFTFELFGATFAVLNVFGLGLETDLTPMQEMQLSQIWHSIVALALTALIIAHIYIATLGMEGAYDAMGTGQVDRNWAKEHHALWINEQEKSAAPGDD